MTTVQVPVRIRLELDGDQPHPALVELVGAATQKATTRALRRAGDVSAVAGSSWPAEGPDVSVRFTGDQAPQWLADQLTAGVHSAVGTAAAQALAGPQAPPAYTVTPITTAISLRTFTTDDELELAALAWYGGAPPAKFLAIARNGGGEAWQWLVEQGPGGESWGVQSLGSLREFHLPPGAGPAEAVAGFGHRADGLRFVDTAATAAAQRRVLTGLILGYLRGGSSHAPDKRLAAKAAELAARYPWTRPVLVYEFTYRGAAVTWLRSPHDLTRGTVPVAMLTEEIPVEQLRTRGYGDCPPLTQSLVDPIPDAGSPFLHELALEDWDADEYSVFSDLIEQIAFEADVAPGRFAASFVLATLAQIGDQLEGLGELDATWARQSQLKHAATALGLINALMFAVSKAMLDRDRAKRLSCPLAGNAGQWATHLQNLYFPLRQRVIGSMFVAACQDVLLAKMESSAAEIQRRITEQAQYMEVTRATLLILLSDLGELTDLRDRINARASANRPAAYVVGLAQGWDRAASDLVARLDPTIEFDAGDGVVFRAGAYRIQDRHGVWWSRADLDAAIEAMRAEAFEIDPLLARLTDIPDVVRRLRAAQQLDSVGLTGLATATNAAIDREFLGLLDEIRAENAKRTPQVRRDREIAFGLATFHDTAGKGAAAELSGIYAKADELLRPMFADTQIYLDGLNALARHEIGKANLLEFVNLAGLPLLGVFFPVTAFLIGAAQAVSNLRTAYQHRGIQESLLGGDDIISRAQVEAELWGAWIGAVLAFLPELPKGGRAIGSLFRGELRAGLRAGIQELVTRLGEATVQRLVLAYVRDATKGWLVNLALSAAIGRFTAAVAAQVEKGGDVSVLALPQLIDDALSQAARENPRPDADGEGPR
ncbi:hypothetical protein [Kutzneria buriramensis]|uniref:Uncharacterized protein n=1 Tax=Kutzneria buriramensis TaxID=1045776 RepID=A0A3E0HHI8_9PSEU|nr:hypothetical protein [Kutzneria buriramensis]REH45921.1 hypothetical protein BCF44_10753 [Kutzneria buriramensis]